MPASAMPTANRKPIALARPSLNSAKPALNSAPSRLQSVKMRLAGKRSASPVSAKPSVPTMNPAWTALVSQPMSPVDSPHSRLRSSAALFALNHSEVPHNCASTTHSTGWRRTALGLRLGEARVAPGDGFAHAALSGDVHERALVG